MCADKIGQECEVFNKHENVLHYKWVIFNTVLFS